MRTVLAIFLLLAGVSYAQAPELAVCKDGMCVIPQDAYMTLRVFVARMVQAEAGNERAFDRELRRADECEERLKGNKT